MKQPAPSSFWKFPDTFSPVSKALKTVLGVCPCLSRVSMTESSSSVNGSGTLLSLLFRKAAFPALRACWSKRLKARTVSVMVSSPSMPGCSSLLTIHNVHSPISLRKRTCVCSPVILCFIHRTMLFFFFSSGTNASVKSFLLPTVQ